MRVNSASIGVFADRLAAGAAIAVVMLAIVLIASSFTSHSDRDLRAKEVNLIIRQIGHRLLLQTGDLTSRVLPVSQTKGGTFVLRFENEFIFSHDSLMVLSQGSFPKTEFPSGYTVTVHDCMTAGIVYGFQVNNTSRDILPCSGRREPQGCYSIEFDFPDLHEKVEPISPDIDQLTEEPNSDNIEQKASPKLEGFKRATPDHDIAQLAEEHKSVNVDQEAKPKLEEFITTTSDYEIDQLTKGPKSGTVGQEANPKLEKSKPTTFDYPLAKLVFYGMLALGISLLVGRFRKILTPVPVQSIPAALRDQNRTTIKASDQELDVLGNFLFDGKGHRLLLGSEVITLTDKECKILELFNKNFGDLIPREMLMQEVWINEGVITSRSLDMFVSKLRKKLSSDPQLRITNVHGKGYKLEMPGIQFS
ncbi:MAG TPA: winged helix-turn-helix domain-containing protein [Chryseolinea sp.]|nr:winged helix-turn-helix domain-containing protein [Chryseolinea sp.]